MIFSILDRLCVGCQSISNRKKGSRWDRSSVPYCWSLVAGEGWCWVLASQRRQQIAEALEREGAVRVPDLVTMLGVSDMTVRRDLDVMQRAGLLTKVHGGAMMPGNSAEEPSFEAKLSQYPNEKVAIARAAAAHRV